MYSFENSIAKLLGMVKFYAKLSCKSGDKGEKYADDTFAG